MKRTKFYIIIPVFIAILIFSSSSICGQCQNQAISNGNISESITTEKSQTVGNETITSLPQSETIKKSVPTIRLEVIEGPKYSSADDIYYYRIKAVVTGYPSPDVAFSKDDSKGAWGKFIAQVNLKKGETYNLIAKATNSEGYATANINLSWDGVIYSASDSSPESTSSASTETDSATTSSDSVIASEPDIYIRQLPQLAIFHPFDIGYIVFPTGINTNSAIIGDSINNSVVRGYFSFDISGLMGKNIISATLELKTFKTYDNPLSTFLGTIDMYMIEDYLPLGPEDWNPTKTGTFGVAFVHDAEPLVISGERLKNAIQQRVNEGKNLYFYILYYNPESSDNDFQTDGREFTKDTISLMISCSE